MSENNAAAESKGKDNNQLSDLVLNELLKERKKDRFWKNVRGVLFLVSVVIGFIEFYYIAPSGAWDQDLSKGYVAMVRIDGEISPGKPANAASINNALDRAFNDTQAKGVIIDINSPGGSPVQSDSIREHIKALRQSHDKTKVWAVGEDSVTSGAYYIATGSNNICVNGATIAGSIGVVNESWGLQAVAKKLGVERRTFTAGINKRRFDAFKELTPEDQEKMHNLLGKIHQQFIAAVKDGRGDRLKGDEAQLFSGDFWTGNEAVSLGLADRLCDLSGIMDSEYQVQHFKDYTQPPSLFERLSIGASIKSAVEEWLDNHVATQFSPELKP